MAKISKKIAELVGTDEQSAMLKEQFSFLQNIAVSKCNEFRSELEKMFMGELDKFQIVGKRAIAYYQGQHIDIKAGCDDAISEAINSFFKGSSGLKDGFKALVTSAMTTLMGATAIGEHQEDLFFIYPENFNIVRVDVKCYKYTFSEGGFISKCENVFCYTMAKSIVDHRKLTVDELLYFVTNMFNKGSENEVDPNEVIDFIKKLEEIWDLLSNDVIPDNHNESNSNSQKSESQFLSKILL